MASVDWPILVEFLGKVGTTKEKVGILKVIAGLPVSSSSIPAPTLVKLGLLAFSIGFWPTYYLKEKYIASLTVTSLPVPPTAPPDSFSPGSDEAKVDKIPGDTTYSGDSSPDGLPPYHLWSGLAGVHQQAYLSAVPNRDKVVWPYLRTGWVEGHFTASGVAWYNTGTRLRKGGEEWLPIGGLNTRDNLLLYFGAQFPQEWTEAGLSWDPSMMSSSHPAYSDPNGYVEWKFEYGWQYRFTHIGGYWQDGGIHSDIMEPTLGNFPHSLAQRGTVLPAKKTKPEDVVSTFTNIGRGLTLAIAVNPAFSGKDVYFDVWEKDQLADYAFRKTKGATADPYTGIDLAKEHKLHFKPAEIEFVTWEPEPKPKEEKVSSVPPKIKKKKMPCCSLAQCAKIYSKLKKIGKDLDEIEKNLTKYLYHDISGHFPPVCVEEGTKNPVTGEPIVDWSNSSAVSALAESPAASAIPEIFAGAGLAGVVKMIYALSHQVVDTAIATPRGKDLWCHVEEPGLVEEVVGSGITDIKAVGLPDGVLYVTIEIVKFEKQALRRYYHEGLWLSSAFPKKGWFGFASFVDDKNRASSDMRVNYSKINFPLPFPSKWIVLRLEPSVQARVIVTKFNTKKP